MELGCTTLAHALVSTKERKMLREITVCPCDDNMKMHPYSFSRRKFITNPDTMGENILFFVFSLY